MQLYGTDDVASVARPAPAACSASAASTSIQPRPRPLRFTVDPSRLAFYDADLRFVCEPGDFAFAISESALDTRRSATVRLDGEVAEYRQRDIVATRVEVQQ